MPLRLQAAPPDRYLSATAVVDHDHPAVADRAARLGREHAGDVPYAAAAFAFVRDEIAHSWDAQDRRVTVSASETLTEAVGLCFGKAHLLAALLRARGIPAGFCYQRLTDDEQSFMLHGLIAVHLEGGWHRQDPRGNKPGVDAQFSLGAERLAWPVRPELGEREDPRVFAAPHPAVVAAMRGAGDMLALCDGGLPDEL